MSRLEKLINGNNKFFQFMGQAGDFIMENLLMMVFAVPEIIVIRCAGRLLDMSPILTYILMFIASLPMGPAITALNYVQLKMVRNTDSYLLRDFFHSYRQNLRQGLILMGIFMIFTVVGLLDFIVLIQNDFKAIPGHVSIPVLVVLIIIVYVFVWVFPILSHFSNTTRQTVHNAFFCSMRFFPRTLGMIACWCIPVAMFLFMNLNAAFIIFFFIGISVPSYFCVNIYNKAFLHFEEKAETE